MKKRSSVSLNACRSMSYEVLIEFVADIEEKTIFGRVTRTDNNRKTSQTRNFVFRKE